MANWRSATDGKPPLPSIREFESMTPRLPASCVSRRTKKLGAAVYIDSQSVNVAEALQEMGGAQVILATAPSSKAMSQLIDGLATNGGLMVVK
jgi:hypothetical protein